MHRMFNRSARAEGQATVVAIGWIAIAITFALALMFASIASAQVRHVCEKAGSGRKVRDLINCRPQGSLLPTPSPTATPRPTGAPQDCSDGKFLHNSTARTLSFGSSARPYVFEPGRAYHLCFDQPPTTRPFIEVSSVNAANASCNVYGLWLTAPSGYTVAIPKSVQPGAPPLSEAGRWSVIVILDDDPMTLCNENKGLSLTVRY